MIGSLRGERAPVRRLRELCPIGIGARVRGEAGGLIQIREVDGGNGYAGESTRRVHFGLGTATRIEGLEIKWPSGHTDQVIVPLNRVSYIEEGVGGTAR